MADDNMNDATTTSNLIPVTSVLEQLKMKHMMNNGCSDGTACNIKTDKVFNILELLVAEELNKKENEAISILTLKLRILNRVMRYMGLSFEDVQHIQETHIHVHPENARKMMQLCNKAQYSKLILSQDFIQPDKLTKLIRYMCKHGHSNAAQVLLANDGLGGVKLNHGPNMDVKRYLDNLKIGSAQSAYDRKCGWKQVHVRAVRKVYKELENDRNGKLEYDVYQVMCQVLKDRADIVLPFSVDDSILEPELLETCVDLYNASMNDEYFTEFVEDLKNKIEPTEPSRKRPRKAKAEAKDDGATEEE